jgi:hypothetical protein
MMTLRPTKDGARPWVGVGYTSSTRDAQSPCKLSVVQDVAMRPPGWGEAVRAIGISELPNGRRPASPNEGKRKTRL